MADLNTRWAISKARYDAAQMEVADALRSNAPYDEAMALIAYEANEWAHFKSVLDEYAEIVRAR